MNARLEAYFELTVRGRLRAYPPAFRARFGGEMLQVYHALARQVSQERGASGLLALWLRALWDGAAGALAEWVQEIMKRRRVTMNPGLLDVDDGTAPLPPVQAFVAVVPFLLFGLVNIASRFSVFQFPPGRASLGVMLVTHPNLVFHWLVLLGLVIGISRGLPRWSFTYLGWAGLNTLLWANLSHYGQPVNWTCLPTLAAVVIPLIVRFRKPLALPGSWRDLTLLPLGLYIAITSMFIIYDENHHPALLFFIAGASLAAALGAWGFFRSGSPLLRALSLTGGMALAILLNLWNTLTWDAAAYYGFTTSAAPMRDVLTAVSFIAVLAVMVLGVGGLAEWLRRRRTA